MVGTYLFLYLIHGWSLVAKGHLEHRLVLTKVDMFEKRKNENENENSSLMFDQQKLASAKRVLEERIEIERCSKNDNQCAGQF